MSALRWPQTVQINLSCDIGDEAGPVCLGARAHSLNFLVGRQLGYISILNRNGDTALIDRKRAPLRSRAPATAEPGHAPAVGSGSISRHAAGFLEMDFLSDRRDRVSGLRDNPN
jgi:hypothetical protein